MKICFLNTNHAWGGGEKWHFEMADALRKRGHSVMIICSPGSALEKKSKSQNIPTRLLKTSNLSFINPIKIFLLSLIIRQNRVKVLFTNLPIDTKIAALIKPFSGLKKLIYRRGMPHPIRNTLLNVFVFNQVDKIIANSQQIKNSLCENLTHLKEKTYIIYNGVTPREENVNRTYKSPLILGNLGRLVKQKGQLDLIEIANHLKQKDFKFKLLIAGKGDQKAQLEQKIKAYKLESDVELLGYQESDTFLSKIDLLVFPSRFEGSANAIIEASNFGVPTVAYDVSSMPELVEHNKTGVLIPPFNIELMAQEIINFINNPELLKSYSKNSIELVKQKFCYKDKVQEVETLIYEAS